MSAVPHLDLDIKQGEDYDLELGIKDQNYAIQPITGWVVHMQIRTKPGGDMVADLSSPSGGIVVDGTNGKINISIPTAITRNFSLTRYQYDIQVVTPTPKTNYLMSGNVNVEPSITAV